MPKFNVTISKTNIVTVEISANDEREACDIANEMMANDEIDFSNGNTEYNIDSVYKI
jgi:RNase H-fold protein (predicted Holliday junction resolvase)